MTLANLFQTLRPRTARFFDLLGRHAKVANAGARILEEFARGESSATEALAAVRQVEQESDRLLTEMEELLATTVVTPIDRDDLQRLSSALGGVIGQVRAALTTCVTLDVVPTEATLRLSAALARSTTTVATAVGELDRGRYFALLDAARELKKLTKTANTTYQEAISNLVGLDAIDSVGDARAVVREEMVLECLSRAIGRANLIGKIFAQLAAKHG